MLKSKKGITLIVLIITIIVLLILAGVSITLVVGDNGTLTKAQKATTETNKASIKEELELEDENFLEDVMTIIKENPGCSPKELSAIYLDRV